MLEGTIHAQTIDGTRLYIAPEMWMQKPYAYHLTINRVNFLRRYTATVDIFSLGCVLYEVVGQEVLTESFAFKVLSPNPTELLKAISTVKVLWHTV